MFRDALSGRMIVTEAFGTRCLGSIGSIGFEREALEGASAKSSCFCSVVHVSAVVVGRHSALRTRVSPLSASTRGETVSHARC